MTDLIGAVELTASAAIVIAVLSIGFGSSVKTRIAIAASLALWLSFVVALAATRAVHYPDGAGTPGLGLMVAFPILFISTALLRFPALTMALRNASPALLIGVHAVRVLGVSFLILHHQNRLPAPFAPLAGWGDILVGLAALPVAIAVAQFGLKKTRAWVLAFTSFGLADLILAIGLGVVSSPGPTQLIFGQPDSSIMTLLPWLIIPGFLVPLLITAHLALLYRIWREARPRADIFAARQAA